MFAIQMTKIPTHIAVTQVYTSVSLPKQLCMCLLIYYSFLLNIVGLNGKKKILFLKFEGEDERGGEERRGVERGRGKRKGKERGKGEGEVRIRQSRKRRAEKKRRG